MVETSAPRDAFARRAAPATDHFRRKDGGGAGDRFRTNGPAFDPARPKQDAFARKHKPAKQMAPAPKAQPRAAAVTPAPAAEAQKRAPLHVVASQAQPQPSIDELMFGRDEQAEVDARLRRSAKSSSFVLVTGGGAAAAASTDTIDAPPPAPAAPPPAPQAERAPLIPETPKRSGGGGGGDGGDYYGAGAATIAPSRKRGIDQDDIAGIIFGLAVIIFLLLWLFRGRDEGQLAESDPLLSTQFAATDTGPPPPFTPQPDPFGEMPVDLKPTGPIPEPLPEVTPPADSTAPSGGSFSTAQVNPAAPPPAAAPTLPVEPAVPATPPPAAAAVPPATPAALSKLSSNAWFCTGSSNLTDAARADLLKGIAAFRPHAKEPMVVHAYADTRGTSVYNLALSGSRARVVADFLRANGLVVAEFEGKGELDGLADNQNCANQRRADIFFKSGSDLRPSAACLPPPEATASICG